MSAVPLSPDDVAALARLARIELTAEELAHLAPQLDVILESVAHVSDVAAGDIPPTSHALPITNVFRTDEVQPSLPLADVLAGAPAAEQDRFRVPRILGEEA
jgi:aspartyl-tRNA(Asn)/glutamyl-tRNA(Gln) amidotransferase subunit C